MRSTIILGIMLGLGAPLGTATAVEIAVIESTSPRYAAGQMLDATVSITLVTGESVTVVTEDARLIKIEGPHDGPASGPPPDPSAVRRALAQLIVEERPAVGGVGGVRGEGQEEQAADTRPDPWFVHAQRSGDQCVLRGSSVGVWRENPASDAAVVEVGVSLADSSARIRWDAGQQRSTLPAEMALIDDTIYLLRPTDSLRSVPIRLHLLEPALSGGGQATAAWLAAKGCIDQARLLLRAAPPG